MSSLLTRPRILIAEARFYDALCDNLLRGALVELGKADALFTRIAVPGVLELPATIAIAVEAMKRDPLNYHYDGFIAFGCVIKGSSDHYDHVCREAMGGLSDVALEHRLALGNGVLTVHDQEQAEERADPARLNIGGSTARACLRMIAAKKELGL